MAELIAFSEERGAHRSFHGCEPVIAQRVRRYATIPRRYRCAEGSLLVYCRWWVGDQADVFVVRAEHDADVLRVGGFNPRRPHDLARARVLLRDRGEVSDMVAAVLDLPAPLPGVPLTLRSAQASRSVEHVAALGNF